jgi:hypothetical protein
MRTVVVSEVELAATRSGMYVYHSLPKYQSLIGSFVRRRNANLRNVFGLGSDIANVFELAKHCAASSSVIGVMAQNGHLPPRALLL